MRDSTPTDQKAIAYIRVSHVEQQREGISLDAQHKKALDYASLRGMTLLDVVVDGAVSAGKPLRTRPGGTKLLQHIEAGRINAVLALKLDRLFRNAEDCLSTVNAWDTRGVALHLIDQGGTSINTRETMGRFLLTIMAGVAEMERNMIADRTRAVMDHKRSRGELLGTAPYGTMRGPGKLLVPNPEEQRVIAMIREKAQAGMSPGAIARWLTEAQVPGRGTGWHRTTIIRILQQAG